jgi:hypothetical protein
MFCFLNLKFKFTLKFINFFDIYYNLMSEFVLSFYETNLLCRIFFQFDLYAGFQFWLKYEL